MQDGQRFSCSGLDAIDNGDRVGWSPCRTPHTIRLTVAIEVAPNGSGYLQSDSYGEGEWLDQRHGIRSRRRWRKLHLGIDAATHEIIAAELMPDDVGDVSEMPELLDQIDTEVASMTADGAYDGEAVYDAVAEHHPEAVVIIPPRTTAVPDEKPITQRNRHIAAIEEHGRMGWQRRSG